MLDDHPGGLITTEVFTLKLGERLEVRRPQWRLLHMCTLGTCTCDDLSHAVCTWARTHLARYVASRKQAPKAPLEHHSLTQDLL
eukprot:3554211-Amphidinium_carterae.1